MKTNKEKKELIGKVCFQHKMMGGEELKKSVYNRFHFKPVESINLVNLLEWQVLNLSRLISAVWTAHPDSASLADEGYLVMKQIITFRKKKSK
jgi:hypothetical protein